MTDNDPTAPRMLAPRISMSAAAALLGVQALVIARFGGQSLGVLLSNLSQLALGILCLGLFIGVYRRSREAYRSYWLYPAAAFGLWVVAQALGTYIDVTSSQTLNSVDDLLFLFSVIPFGMLLFFDPDHEPGRLDRLHLLDFVQVGTFWVSVYLFFSKDPSLAVTSVGWGRFGWIGSAVYDGVLTVSFLLRAFLSKSRAVRALFAHMALFVLCSGLADSYSSFAPNQVEPGHWFDLVWGALLCIPLLIAANWNYVAPGGAVVPPASGQRIVVNELFPLLYPFFSLLVLAHCVPRRPILSTVLIVIVFVGVGLRVLVIQHRLARAQDTLKFEATHDGLTGLLNHAAILERLDLELARHRRTGNPVGLIMVDVDHFKKTNDTYGHIAGDEVLREVARRLEASVRSYDSVGRYGGEEFLVVVPSCDHLETLHSGERLRCAVSATRAASIAGPIVVAVSVGFVSTTDCRDNPDEALLLRMADEALYQAKAKGRNRVESAVSD